MKISIPKGFHLIDDQYYKSKNSKCILGLMACHAGISLPSGFNNNARIAGLEGFSHALSEAYGLTLDQLSELQDVNDQHYTETLRVNAVKDLLQQFGIYGEDDDGIIKKKQKQSQTA